MSEQTLPPAPAAAPGLARRLAAFIYEGLLLFAVAMATGLVYSPLAQQRNALEHRSGLIIALALSFGAYFIYFWTRSGQTLPMKTWHMRLQRQGGGNLGLAQALLRYLLSYCWWVLPIAAAVQMRRYGLGFGPIAAVGSLALLGYAMLSLVLPGRQYLHDLLCRTELVTQRPAPKAPKQ
ncbi:RDD family protein [Roseateles violae]|uniref:RDD family protein n=1 Tax=Roseateles violae TaxID=3058042 RepID=A0ABT8DZI4_9BURK|nr:RDD family protein [Pelomonas sp. PFR6]MDN3922974.1 RDD family protein [Pelomonas sp. PFR6]